MPFDSRSSEPVETRSGADVPQGQPRQHIRKTAVSNASRREKLFYAGVMLLTASFALLIVWTALGLGDSAFSFRNLPRGWRTLRYTFTGKRPLEFSFLADIGVNFLLYFPLGLLVALTCRRMG